VKPALFVARVIRPDSQFLGLYFTGRGYWATCPQDACRATAAEWSAWIQEGECRLFRIPREESADEAPMLFADGVTLEPAP